ncbi:MAG: dicarboxylate/amino acid:cation symporter [Bacteroidota bacterium]
MNAHNSKNPSDKSHWHILGGLLAGTIVGVIANLSVGENESAKEFLAFAIDGVAHPIGQIFLRMLFIVVVPLVFASLASGVASLGDLGKLGRMGSRTLLFFLITSSFAAALGIFLLGVVQPGAGFDEEARKTLMASYSSATAELGMKKNVQPTSIIGIVNYVLDNFLPRNMMKAFTEMQMVPIIMFALFVGAALTKIQTERRDVMMKWLDALTEAMVKIVGFAMKLAPYAVFCLIFSVTARFGLDLLQKLGMYVILILGGYAIVLLLFYPILIKFLAKRNPVEYLKGAIPIMVTAFSTSSSNATLPTTIRVSEENLGIRPSVAGFVLPLGATMNMNGTALFEGGVVLFISQVFGVELTLGQQLFVVALAVLSAIGTAGVPGASLPLLMIILAQVNVPPDGIAIILGVDRLLDMGRTVINVMGDVVCAGYVEDFERQEEARNKQ